MAACSTASVIGRRKRSDQSVIEERPMVLTDADEVRPLQEVIKVTKVINKQNTKPTFRQFKNSNFQVQDQASEGKSEDSKLEPSQYLFLFGTTTTVSTVINTAFVANANIQTLRLTQPGCFPQSLFSSLAINAC